MQLRSGKTSDFARFAPVLILAVFLAVASISFQNCSQYAADSSILTDSTLDSSTDCDPTDLTCSDLNNIQITIANQDPLLIRSTPGGSNGSCDATDCVDVAGYCDVDGFASNKISASISGTVSLPDTILGSCDTNGRFRILLPMPSGFVMNTTYQVTVTMRIYDANGTAYVNPSGLNQKTITLTSTP